TLALLVAGLVLVLLDDDLRALGRAEDLDRHGGLVQAGGGDLLAVDDHDDGQLEGSADGLVGLVDLDDIADSNLLLLAATTHDRVHGGLTLFGGGIKKMGRARSTPRVNFTGSRPVGSTRTNGAGRNSYPM